jgi:hypothetical protein
MAADLPDAAAAAASEQRSSASKQHHKRQAALNARAAQVKEAAVYLETEVSGSKQHACTAFWQGSSN